MLYKIVNVTRSAILAEEAEIAQTIFTRAKGLLGRTSLTQGQAMIITQCSCVHTFFMKFPIDVIFINAQYRVLKAIGNLKPFRISPLVWGSRCVLELPVGTITSSLTQKDDQLKIEP